MKNPQTLPRLDLREPAFRRMERLIAKACVETFSLNPKTDVEGISMNPHTFCLRFRDAIIGFKRFKYRSSMIPKGVDLDTIKCTEDTDGLRVHVSNSKTEEFSSIHAAEKARVLEVIAKKRQEPPDPQFYGVEILVAYSTPEQRQWLLTQAGDLGEDKPERKVVSII